MYLHTYIPFVLNIRSDLTKVVFVVGAAWEMSPSASESKA